MKVLDFGLAKAFAADGSGVNLSQSPTLSVAATQQGVILGTAAYMSPEQARGQEVDKRADIWAFGVVLFEMLTGRGTFDGGTVSDVLAGILRADPDWKSLPLNLHPRISFLLERCLEKESKDRYGDISDARVDVQRVLAHPDGVITHPVAGVIQTSAKPILRWVVPAVLISVVVAGAAGWYLKPEPMRPVMRFDYELPEGQRFRNTGEPVFALSPDGGRFVYNTLGGLYLRPMDGLEAVLISGTEENLQSPFFSPDGQWVGYYSSGELKKIAISGGAPIGLSGATRPYGVSWETDGTILFGQPEGIRRVSENGGDAALIIEAREGEQVHGPQLLPGGEWVLFTATAAAGSSRWDQAEIVAESLATHDRVVLRRGGSDARYIGTGHLVYALDDGLFAVPFDLDTLQVTGGAVSMAEGVLRSTVPAQTTATANYGISGDGSLAYVYGVGGLGSTSSIQNLVWLDAQGTIEPLGAPPGVYEHPRLSPDGNWIAVTKLGNDGVPDVWIHDVRRNVSSRLTYDGGEHPIWTPDGLSIVFSSFRDGVRQLFRIAADSSDEEKLVRTGINDRVATSISPQGVLAFEELSGNETSWDLFTASLEDEESPEPFLQTPAGEYAPTFSHDGRWIAYVSGESGRREVYVRAFPGPGGKRQISTEGGRDPAWDRSGRELYYRSLQGDELSAVQVDLENGFSPGPSRVLSNTQFGRSAWTRANYDVSLDGRFLLLQPVDEEAVVRNQINIVLNFFEELKERVPVP